MLDHEEKDHRMLWDQLFAESYGRNSAPRYHKKRVSGSWDRLKFENLRLVGTCVERKKCLSSTGLSLLYVFLFHSCWIVQHTQAILFFFWAEGMNQFSLCSGEKMSNFWGRNPQRSSFWGPNFPLRTPFSSMLATPLSWPLTHSWTTTLGLDQTLSKTWLRKLCELFDFIFWSSSHVVAEGVALADIKGETLLNQVKITQFEGISGGKWEPVYAVAASMVSNDVKWFYLALWWELLHQEPDHSQCSLVWRTESTSDWPWSSLVKYQCT